MTKEEAIKWLTNLKSDIGKMQFQALWGYEQAIDEIIDLLSAETVGAGRYENAMQKLREMPRYLNGIKAKQIKKVSADRPTDEPETEPAPVVAYICDRRRCAICRGKDGGCDHTTDIKHAAHFKNVAGQYFERPYMEEDDG